MGHEHGPVGSAGRLHGWLLGVVALLGAATILGIVALWPTPPPVSDPGQPLQTARIVAVEITAGEPDPFTGGSGDVAHLRLEVTNGPDAGAVIDIEAPTDAYPEFRTGDRVKVARSDTPDGPGWAVVDFERLPALGVLLAAFVALVIAVGRWHGVRSLLGLATSLVLVTRFVVPSILSGNSPFAVALVGSLAVMIVTLYLSHGFNPMTTAAVVGTAIALGLTIALGVVAIDWADLTGFTSDEATMARFTLGELDLRGLVLAGLIIATLGVLDDVTVTQASTVYALHDADPEQRWGTVFARAMRVGRDHIASTVNTLFLAYAGASVALLVLFAVGGSSTTEILNAERFAEEAVKTLVGSMGLISAVPLTTALATTLALGRRAPAPRPVVPPDEDELELDEEERTERAWLRYLRDGDDDDGAVPRRPGAEPGSQPSQRDR